MTYSALRGAHFGVIARAVAQVVSRLINMASNFIIIGLLARALSGEEFGLWGLLIAAYQIVQGLDFGLGAALRNTVTRMLIAQEPERAREIVMSTIGVTLAAAIAAIPILLYAPGLPLLFGLPADSAWVSIIRLVLILSGFMISAGMIAQLYYCWSESHLLALLETVRPVIQISMIAVLARYGAGLRWDALLFYGAFVGVGFLEIILLFQRRGWNPLALFRQTASTQAVAVRVFHDIKLLSVEAGLFALMSATAAINNSVDSVIVAHVRDVAAVGPYTVLQRFYFAGITLHITFLMNYWSVYTEKYHAGDFTWIRATLLRYGLLTVAIAASITIACAFEGRFIVKLWTGLDVPDARLFLSFGFWMLLVMLNNHVSIFLNGIGQIRSQATVMCLAILINIPLAFLLGYRFGAIGVNMATMAGMSIVLVTNIVTASRALSRS